ncbi:MAG: hypothetical protein L0H55_16280 [Candidatus Nitrosocosmicus sp.]|nr:hypothetical protein [Candidatus Nitrosocosmicus sp.]
MEIIGAFIIGFIIGKADVIWKYFFTSSPNKTEKIISLRKQKPEFTAEIIDKKEKYRRGQDIIKFRSRYKGKIDNGYFANEIRIKDTSIDALGYRFEDTTPNVNKDRTAITSFCPETIDNTSNYYGNLNGNINTDWKSWDWMIPQNTPLGKYIIKMMVLNVGELDNPIEKLEDEIEITMPEEPSNSFNRLPITG